MKSTLVPVVGMEAQDGDGAMDTHHVLLTVLCYVEDVWRKLKNNNNYTLMVLVPVGPSLHNGP